MQSSTLTNGLALLVVNAISKKFTRQKDEIEILDGDKAVSGVKSFATVPANTLSVENQELVSRIVSQHTSHRAFKEIHNERVRTMRDEIRGMGESVLPVIRESGTPIVIQSSEYSIELGMRPRLPSKPSLTKKVSLELLKDAINQSLRDLHIDGSRSYDFRVAAQIMGHVQFRPLVRHYYNKNVEQWRGGASSTVESSHPPPTQLSAKIGIRKVG